MQEDGYYPVGAQYDKNAPYNKTENKEKIVDVNVQIKMSKTFPIKVTDYTYNDDNEVDFSKCNIVEALNDQYILPYNAYTMVVNNKAYKDLSGWALDDIDLFVE